MNYISSEILCPRLIEVALPIREISAESVRDKSIRHGHISTLHLWWARRPLSACRAIVFASLVPAVWSYVVEDEEWVLRKVGSVTLQKAGLVPDQGGIRIKDAV